MVNTQTMDYIFAGHHTAFEQLAICMTAQVSGTWNILAFEMIS